MLSKDKVRLCLLYLSPSYYLSTHRADWPRTEELRTRILDCTGQDVSHLSIHLLMLPHTFPSLHLTTTATVHLFMSVCWGGVLSLWLSWSPICSPLPPAAKGNFPDYREDPDTPNGNLPTVQMFPLVDSSHSWRLKKNGHVLRHTHLQCPWPHGTGPATANSLSSSCCLSRR